MADITIQISDENLAKVIEAFAASYGYQTEIPHPDKPEVKIPNPETTAAFTRRKVFEYIQDVTRAHFIKQAAETARRQAETAAEAIKL